MFETLPRPPYDSELAAGLAVMGHLLPPPITADMIPLMRQSTLPLPIDELLAGRAIDHTEHSIAGATGDPDVILSVFTPHGLTGPAPAVFHIHGGGMILGDRFFGIDGVLDWVVQFGLVAVSAEYRLAPEDPHPAPIEDCYAGLVWTAAHAAELGIDPKRLVVGGTSAGGGLAAGVALLSRDRGGPALAGQWLSCPMLDDRDHTVSSRQYVDGTVWPGVSNSTGWTALLGADYQGENVSIYAAPARATDLAHLPPAFIDVGSAEVFRDEDVAYASALWTAGVQAELHVWAGGYHGFEAFGPLAAVSAAARDARTDWLRRLLAL